MTFGDLRSHLGACRTLDSAAAGGLRTLDVQGSMLTTCFADEGPGAMVSKSSRFQSSALHADQRHTLDNLQAVAVKPRNFTRTVGQQADLGEPKLPQDLSAQPIFA